jgi:hypothetical protein
LDYEEETQFLFSLDTPTQNADAINQSRDGLLM